MRGPELEKVRAIDVGFGEKVVFIIMMLMMTLMNIMFTMTLMMMFMRVIVSIDCLLSIGTVISLSLIHI